MCGRFTITVTLEELITHYLIDDSKLATLKPNYNVAPMHNVPAVIASDEGNALGNCVGDWCRSGPKTIRSAVR